jgi:hypothetical protein
MFKPGARVSISAEFAKQTRILSRKQIVLMLSQETPEIRLIEAKCNALIRPSNKINHLE